MKSIPAWDPLYDGYFTKLRQNRSLGTGFAPLPGRASVSRFAFAHAQEAARRDGRRRRVRRNEFGEWHVEVIA